VIGLGSEKQMVTLNNIYNMVRELIKNMGFKSTADYITDPNDEGAEHDPVEEKRPSPEEIEMQLKQHEMQLEAQKTRAEIAIKQGELQIKQVELQIKEQELLIEKE
jgi:hypothetical protein